VTRESGSARTREERVTLAIIDMIFLDPAATKLDYVREKLTTVAVRPGAALLVPGSWKLPVIRSRRGPASPGPSARFFRRTLSSPRRPDDASALRGGPVAMVKPLKGVVVSNSMMKSVTVMVERLYKHPRWGKYVRGRKKYMVRPARNARNAPAAPRERPERPATRPDPGRSTTSPSRPRARRAVEP
jgi:hypothetical protein